jgi:hypothetical protein
MVVPSGMEQPICEVVAVVQEPTPGPVIVRVDPSPWIAPNCDDDAIGKSLETNGRAVPQSAEPLDGPPKN